jgi:hypothetical protein
VAPKDAPSAAAQIIVGREWIRSRLPRASPSRFLSLHRPSRPFLRGRIIHLFRFRKRAGSGRPSCEPGREIVHLTAASSWKALGSDEEQGTIATPICAAPPSSTVIHRSCRDARRADYNPSPTDRQQSAPRRWRSRPGNVSPIHRASSSVVQAPLVVHNPRCRQVRLGMKTP